jgi:hypothetical protein
VQVTGIDIPGVAAVGLQSQFLCQRVRPAHDHGLDGVGLIVVLVHVDVVGIL